MQHRFSFRVPVSCPNRTVCDASLRLRIRTVAPSYGGSVTARRMIGRMAARDGSGDGLRYTRGRMVHEVVVPGV